MAENSFRKIMIVEDDQIISADLAFLVKHFGYDVATIVGNGEEALDFAMTHKPDLALMDIVLPGKLDGIETASALRMMYNVPVVFISAFSDEETIERAKRAEPFAYLTKPFRDHEVERSIELALYRSRAERLIKEQKDLLSAILQGVESGVIAVDEVGRIQLLNSVASRLTGWSNSEATGKPLATILKLKHEPADIVQRMLTLRQHTDVAAEFVVVRRDGTEFTVACAVRRVDPGATNPAGLVITLNDITARRKAEETLRESEERFQATFNSIDDAIITTDVESKIVRVNRAAEVFTGWTERDARGKPIGDVLELLNGSGERTAAHLVSSILVDGNQFVQSERILMISRDGRRAPVSAKAVPLWNSRGDLSGAVLVLSDQADRNRVEHHVELSP